MHQLIVQVCVASIGAELKKKTFSWTERFDTVVLLIASSRILEMI